MSAKHPVSLYTAELKVLQSGDTVFPADLASGGSNGQFLTYGNSTSMSWTTGSGGSFSTTNVIGGRLYGTSGSPWADNASITTLYYGPVHGNSISFDDGTVITFAETSISLSGLTSGKVYDVFAFNNSGTLAFDSPLVWTNTTTRATGVTLTNGRWVKNGDSTRILVGSFYTSATGTTVDNAATNRHLWNAYNQILRTMYYFDGSSHTVSSHDITNFFTGPTFLDGLGLNWCHLTYQGEFQGASASSSNFYNFGVSLVSATLGTSYNGGAFNNIFSIYTADDTLVNLGLNTIYVVGNVDSGTITINPGGGAFLNALLWM